MTIFYNIIASKDQCETWLKELWNSNYKFHIDDKAEDIICGDKKLFTPIQCDIINTNLDICFEVLNNPWDIYYLDNDEKHVL